MEHLRRVNKLWASDSIHLRKLLLIPIAVPLDGSTSRSSSRSDNGSPAAGSPEPVFRDSNFPAGSRENPLNKAEAMQLLRSYDNADRPGTPDSTSTSSSDAMPSEPVIQTPLDFFARMDQSIASCRKNTEETATNWRFVFWRVISTKINWKFTLNAQRLYSYTWFDVNHVMCIMYCTEASLDYLDSSLIICEQRRAFFISVRGLIHKTRQTLPLYPMEEKVR